MRNAKIGNIIVCLTLIAAMLLGGCASENAFDACSKVDNSSNASNVSVNQGDASLGTSDTTNASDTSDDISDTINNASADVNDTSNDNGKEDQNNPENPTVTGEDVMDELLEYAHGIYAMNNNISYDTVVEWFASADYKSFGIYTRYNYDSVFDAGTDEFWDGHRIIDCIVWGLEFKDEMGEQVILIRIPHDDSTMIALCEKFGVASNNLSALKFTVKDIFAVDSETAQLLLNLIDATKKYNEHKTPDNKPGNLNK